MSSFFELHSLLCKAKPKFFKFQFLVFFLHTMLGFCLHPFEFVVDSSVVQIENLSDTLLLLRGKLILLDFSNFHALQRLVANFFAAHL